MQNYLYGFYPENYSALKLSLKELAEFYWRAKRALWATSSTAFAVSEGVEEWAFEEGDFKYTRRRYGYCGFSEQEMLVHKKNPVWVLNAHGGMDWFPGEITAGGNHADFSLQTRVFLDEALKRKKDGTMRSGGGSFRGCEYVQDVTGKTRDLFGEYARASFQESGMGVWAYDCRSANKQGELNIDEFAGSEQIWFVKHGVGKCLFLPENSRWKPTKICGVCDTHVFHSVFQGGLIVPQELYPNTKSSKNL